MKKYKFYEWEEKHKLLNNRSIGEFQYWNYMRRDMVMSFKDESSEVEPAFYKQMKEQSKEGIFKKFKTLKVLFSGNPMSNIPSADILFLCHSRRQEIDGKMVSIYTDYIADRFPGSVSIQIKGLGKYSEDKIYSKNLIFLDKISTKAYIYRYLMKFFHPIRYRQIFDKVKMEMAEPFKDLHENYGLHPDLDQFAGRATVLYFLYRYKTGKYEKIINKISPKLITEVVGGAFDVQIINEIADKKKIPVIELQHGTISTQYPKGLIVRQHPDYFFSFGDFWSRRICLPVAEGHVISTGFPYHDMMMEAYSSDAKNKDENTVIFISSRKYGKEFSELAVKIKNLKPELKIIYKLHPREAVDYKERYSELCNSDIEIIDDNKTPLYDLFSRSSIQVGVESTAIYEGMGFNLETYIWDIPMAVSMMDIVEQGYAETFKNAEEFIQLLDSHDREKKSYDIGDFWMN
ncbi:MAG: alpha-2,8-polysialyltransferase family protein, partial [Lachnospiraceae bacterium]|nr:alpha-2,8-polysialyltransferase family protein [Lachnospiraceae bacterium]